MRILLDAPRIRCDLVDLSPEVSSGWCTDKLGPDRDLPAEEMSGRCNTGAGADTTDKPCVW